MAPEPAAAHDSGISTLLTWVAVWDLMHQTHLARHKDTQSDVLLQAMPLHSSM